MPFEAEDYLGFSKSSRVVFTNLPVYSKFFNQNQFNANILRQLKYDNKLGDSGIFKPSDINKSLSEFRRRGSKSYESFYSGHTRWSMNLLDNFLQLFIYNIIWGLLKLYYH